LAHSRLYVIRILLSKQEAGTLTKFFAQTHKRSFYNELIISHARFDYFAYAAAAVVRLRQTIPKFVAVSTEISCVLIADN
jgi:hypothetical protein